MSCQVPSTKEKFMQNLINVVFKLRNTPFPGPSPESILDLFNIDYPEMESTLEEITLQLNSGAKRGIFTKCMYPAFSNEFYYNFNRNMINVNSKNKQFGLPVIYDLNKSGSAYPTNNIPMSAQYTQHGLIFGAGLNCNVPPPEPLQRPSRFTK